VANLKLRDILENIGEKVKVKGMTLKMRDNAVFDTISGDHEAFSEFEKLIQKEWELFKSTNRNRVLKRTYMTFLYLKIQEFFRIYLHDFCGFEENSLDLVLKEKISEENLFLEYQYRLSEEEKDYFSYSHMWLYYFSGINPSHQIKGNGHDLTYPLGYLYMVISFFGVIIRKILQEKVFIVLDGAVIKRVRKNYKLDFLIIVKNSKDQIFEDYYEMALYYFLKHLRIVPEDYLENLLKGREALYQKALDEYPHAKEKLVDLLYYFYRKCSLLQNFSPLLDFFNFVCSRVEDSIYSKLDIIKKEFLINFEYTEEKKGSLLTIFNYLDRKATLYSTFQANNLPSMKSQFNLFLLYMKYYFGSGSLEALEIGDLLFSPETFTQKLDKYNRELNYMIDANTIKDIRNFIDHCSTLSNTDFITLIFQKIFKATPAEINFNFFKTFLRSLNWNLLSLMEIENDKLSENVRNEPLTFTSVVDHICRMLYTLIDKIFITTHPERASKNFIDPRSRYVGKNIALRVLELFIFQDLNISDDVWPDYIISLHKEKLITDLKQYQIDIPAKHFYNVEDIIRFLVTYNFEALNHNISFEEWLIDDIILPLNEFITLVEKSVKKKGNKEDICNVLKTFILENNNTKIHSERDITFECERLANFWLE